MKPNESQYLVKIKYESCLYGTNGPESDIDWKVIYLPSIEDLLLNKILSNHKSAPNQKNEKMGAGEEETEFIPLHIFLDHHLNGVTYAVEVAQGILQGHAEFFQHEMLMKQLVTELVDNFTTKNLKGMIGYAISQSRKYGLKTRRFDDLNLALQTVNDWCKQQRVNESERIGDHPNLIQELCKIDCIGMTVIETKRIHQDKEPVAAIKLSGKYFPLQNTIATVKKSIISSIETYGDRVKSFAGEGTDWKALSHALRIIDQVYELSETGKIQFPVARATYYRDIKFGKYDLDTIIDELTEKFESIDDVIADSILVEKNQELVNQFTEWKLNYLKKLYLNKS